MTVDTVANRLQSRSLYTESIVRLNGEVITGDERQFYVNRAVLTMAFEVIRIYQTDPSKDELYSWAVTFLGLFLDDESNKIVKYFKLYNQLVDLEYSCDEYPSTESRPHANDLV